MSEQPERPTRTKDLLAAVDHEIVQLLTSLPEDAWATPSLCASWTVGDVAVHIVSGGTSSVVTVSREMVRCRGNFNRANVAIVRQMKSTLTGADIVSSIANRRGRPQGLGRLLPTRFMLGDHVVHLHDMAIPLGREVSVPPAALTAVLNTQLRVPNPFVPSARIGRGFSFSATDIEWSRVTDGPEIRGRAADLVLALGGRIDPNQALDGAGVPVMNDRIETWRRRADQSECSWR